MEERRRLMSQTKTFAKMTPEERQKMIDDICRAFGASEVHAALLAEHAPDKELELPEPDQIIHKGKGAV
jgi:DNA-directed RNA polymerase subunit F